MIRAVIYFVLFSAKYLVKTASHLTFFSQVKYTILPSETWYFLSHTSPAFTKYLSTKTFVWLFKQNSERFSSVVSCHLSLPLYFTPKNLPFIPPNGLFYISPLGRVKWAGGPNFFTGNWIWCVSLFSAGVKEHQPQSNSKWKSSTQTLVVQKLCKDPFNRHFILVVLKDKKGFRQLTSRLSGLICSP